MSHINCPCCNNEIIVKNTMSEAMKKAQRNYREKNPEKYNDNSKAYYQRKKEDPEWVAKNNERIRIYKKERYYKKKEEEALKKLEMIEEQERLKKKAESLEERLNTIILNNPLLVDKSTL